MTKELGLMEYISNFESNNPLSEKEVIISNKMIFSRVYNDCFLMIITRESMIMNKNTYPGLALAACMGVVSAPLLAEVSPAPEHPANITAPATTAPEHQEAAELHKKHAEHHKAMAEHLKSVAAEYEKYGNHDLKTLYEILSTHHEALAKEHEKAAATHEKMAKSK